MYNAYNAEEIELKKYVKCISIDDIPYDANAISSHTVYKTKIEEDDQLWLKSRRALHGNEESIKYEMKSDRAMCSLTGIRAAPTISTTYVREIICTGVKLRSWRHGGLNVMCLSNDYENLMIEDISGCFWLQPMNLRALMQRFNRRLRN